MSEISSTEENYLKAVLKLSEDNQNSISTSAIAKEMQTAAASVTDMVKRLTDKGYLFYEKYKGVRLSPAGKFIALMLIRKHRLWETFMVDKLGFSWDEVHPVAEQLEHIKSDLLIDRLDAYLNYPKIDPHGDPIPDRDGNIAIIEQELLSDLELNTRAIVVGVKEYEVSFLKYLEQLGLILGAELKVVECFSYDASLRLELGEGKSVMVSHKVAKNLYVKQG